MTNRTVSTKLQVWFAALEREWLRVGDEKLIRDLIDPCKGETGAFMLWCLANSDITAFLRLSSKWSTAAVDRLWADIGKRPGHEDGPAEVDVLFEEIGGGLPHNYDWMLHSAVLKGRCHRL